MLRPLTKHTRNGDRYYRPANIETQIESALRLTWTELQENALIADQSSLSYMSTECLIYLIRNANHDHHVRTREKLLLILMRRCQSVLKATLSDSQVPNAAYLRDEVLSRLSELFAQDHKDINRSDLDYFEIHFNKAFAALRTDVMREKLRTFSRSYPIPDDKSIESLPNTVMRKSATQENHLLLKQILDTLPPEERRAIVLCKIMGYAEESDDPSKQTAAKICGVTGRTIRNRIARATSRLAKWEKNLDQVFLEKKIYGEQLIKCIFLRVKNM